MSNDGSPWDSETRTRVYNIIYKMDIEIDRMNPNDRQDPNEPDQFDEIFDEIEKKIIDTIEEEGGKIESVKVISKPTPRRSK